MNKLRNKVTHSAANAMRRLGHNYNEATDSRVIEMQRTINALNNHSIQFNIEQYPDGNWSAESTNISGIMTSDRDPQKISELIKDAIFTYFEIPPQPCRDELLRSDNEPAKIEQTIHIGA